MGFFHLVWNDLSVTKGKEKKRKVGTQLIIPKTITIRVQLRNGIDPTVERGKGALGCSLGMELTQQWKGEMGD